MLPFFHNHTIPHHQCPICARCQGFICAALGDANREEPHRSHVHEWFTSGHLAEGPGSRPHVVPVYLENLNRILPKGEFLPVPLLARIVFGVPTTLEGGEAKEQFLARLRGTVVALKGAWS